jgi:hypothetical protein
MGDGFRAILIVAGTVLVVVLFNYAILRLYLKKQDSGTQVMMKSLDMAKTSWNRENEKMNELAKLVKEVTDQTKVQSESDRPNNKNS